MTPLHCMELMVDVELSYYIQIIDDYIEKLKIYFNNHHHNIAHLLPVYNLQLQGVLR